MALELEIRAEAPIPLAARLSAAPGEVLALVGPSGSGKSTLLRAIAGLWRPPAGRVAVDGEVWFDAAAGIFVPPHRRAAGMVFQNYALFPHMSAEGNVAAALGALPAAARAARARALLAQVNLAGLEHRRPAEMSGGQQQRVAVARALARSPKVLLLDEPFAAVDRATRERLYREIAELRRGLNMPVLLVTHDLDEAMRLADRMVVLHQGRTLQSGAPWDVAARPATPEVARLVGVRNLFEAEVAPAPDRLDWAGLRLEVRPGALAGAAPGDRVAWAIPDGYVVLHRRDRPSRGERENPVPGRIAEALALGQTAEIAFRPDHAPDRPLHFSLPLHVLERNGLAPGAAAAVSLLAEGIHLMRPEAG